MNLNHRVNDIRSPVRVLRRDRAYEDGLAKKALIDAFRIIEDDDLVGQYRRKMASLLF